MAVPTYVLTQCVESGTGGFILHISYEWPDLTPSDCKKRVNNRKLLVLASIINRSKRNPHTANYVYIHTQASLLSLSVDVQMLTLSL
jgi:hypothetical protein